MAVLSWMILVTGGLSITVGGQDIDKTQVKQFDVNTIKGMAT